MTPTKVLRRVRALGLPAYGDDEVRFIAGVMDRYRPTHVFEWGTNVGASARLFYEAALELRVPCEVHTTELPAEQAHFDRDHPGHRYGEWIKGLPIHCYRGDGLRMSMLMHAATLPERALFFLDGRHDYWGVLLEMERVAGRDARAVILVHDTRDLTGSAVIEFARWRPEYFVDPCLSESGMVALWPTSI